MKENEIVLEDYVYLYYLNDDADEIAGWEVLEDYVYLYYLNRSLCPIAS